MLDPKYIDRLPEHMVALYSEAEQKILCDMARRISKYDYWIPTVDWQYQKLIEMGNVHSYVLSELSALTGKRSSELERLMTQAGIRALAADRAVYARHGLTIPSISSSAALQAVLDAGYKQTQQTFENLTSTTAGTATRQFETALDEAWLKIQSGAFDQDAAVHDAVKALARDGIKTIQYPSTHTDTIEVAVRRAVVTGVNQTCGKLSLTLAEDMDCDLVETSAHAGARPEHAIWQGKVFSRSGKSDQYPDFVSSTGYGTGEGLCGWNCRHSFAAYFEGDPRRYSERDIADLNAQTVTYNGQKMSEYEATQKQRYMERQIRRWKRENAAMEAAGADTSESAAKLAKWRKMQDDFLKQTGLRLQSARTRVSSE